jgi:toxin ParE1/3/4
VKVLWTDSAIADVRAARQYIARDNAHAAKRVAGKIMSTAQALLAEHPYIGRAGRVDGTRELIVSSTPYIIAYHVVGAAVEVLRVVHSSKEWPESF